MVLTYTSAEAKAKAKGKGGEPIRLVEAKPKAQPVERIKWKKERKRRIRRSHNPRVTLKSVAREAEPIRLRSVPPPVQGARKRASELKGTGDRYQELAPSRLSPKAADSEGG